MKSFTKLSFAAAAALAVYAAPSQAATIIQSCTSLGLDDIVPNASTCVGYYSGNELTSDVGDNASADETAALLLLGLGGTPTVLEKLTGSGNFVMPMNGLTYVGIHYGRGQGPVNNPGGVTAFYKFDAGVNLDQITFTNGSVSGVVLYSTGTPSVPEPASWAMLIAGMGIVGASMRRRKTAVSFA